MKLLRQSSESLAGRIAIVELDAINVLKAHTAGIDQTQLWMRGGFPLSLTAASLQDSFEWRSDFIRTYLERDIPSFAKGANVSLLDNLWTMLSYAQGSILNLSSLSRSLGVSSPTVQHYIDLLEKLLLIRLIRPFHANIKKRYVKSPKVFIRDSGLAHAQLGLMTDVQVLGHSIVGHSWEGFVIENILSVAPPRSRYGFYRTAKGAEIDLVLQFPGLQSLWALEIKRSVAASVRRGFYTARNDVSATKSFLVHPGSERFMLKHGVEAIGLLELCEQISAGSHEGHIS